MSQSIVGAAVYHTGVTDGNVMITAYDNTAPTKASTWYIDKSHQITLVSGKNVYGGPVVFGTASVDSGTNEILFKNENSAALTFALAILIGG